MTLPGRARSFESVIRAQPQLIGLADDVIDGRLIRAIRALLLHTTGDRIDLRAHTYDYGNCTPTAGVWYGRRGDNCWKWELAFRPPAATAQ